MSKNLCNIKKRLLQIPEARSKSIRMGRTKVKSYLIHTYTVPKYRRSGEVRQIETPVPVFQKRSWIKKYKLYHGIKLVLRKVNEI
jgi:hypothetical protein